MLIHCPECGEQISEDATSCPKCGLPNPAAGRTLVLARLHARRRKVALRIGGIICIALLCFGIVSAVLRFRWPVRYEIGAVSGTTAITQERFASLVTEAASTWNTAASRTVLWRFPLGRPVRISLAVDTGREDYLVMRQKIELRLQEARETLISAQAAYDAFLAAHPRPAQGYQFRDLTGLPDTVYAEYAVKAIEDELTELDDAHANGRLPGPKDTYIAFSPEGAAAPGKRTSSVSITAYLDETQLRIFILHALGHAIGLQDSLQDDAMSATGRSTTITKALAAEAAAGH